MWNCVDKVFFFKKKKKRKKKKKKKTSMVLSPFDLWRSERHHIVVSSSVIITIGKDPLSLE